LSHPAQRCEQLLQCRQCGGYDEIVFTVVSPEPDNKANPDFSFPEQQREPSVPSIGCKKPTAAGGR
jgi:hypothetical protein